MDTVFPLKYRSRMNTGARVQKAPKLKHAPGEMIYEGLQENESDGLVLWGHLM